MAEFSVLLLTAGPPGHVTEAGGAFVKVDGREALLRSTELFLNRDNVKQIQVVFASDMLDEAKRKYGGHLGLFGVKLLAGGPRWVDQVAAGGEKIADACSHVILHDAARPAVAYSDIDALMQAAESHPAATLTSPLRANLLEVDEGGHPVACHLSTRYVHLLTPQAFQRERFCELAKAKQEPHASELYAVKGSPLNQRVGGPGDAGLVKQMIAMLPKPKIKGPTSPFEEAQW